MIYLFFVLLFTSIHAGASSTCPASYDELNIPHVETSSLEDFYYCFGFHHGQDRAWQMDYFRRVGEGRNAEVLGFSHLKSDLMMRVLDLPAMAQELWKTFPLDKKSMIEMYAKGVNEGFKSGKNSQEFKDLDFTPEPWKPQDTLLVLLLQSFDQTRKTFFRDYQEEKLKSKWGQESAQLFDEDDMPWENTILKEGEYEKRVVESKTTSYQQKKFSLWNQFPSVFGEETGSNNWVVSKTKSKSGKAILANDPHLDLKTPLFWYWLKIKYPEGTVMGASLPGVPIVASGTNGKVSWGLTNSYFNTADALFVKDVPSNEIETFRPKILVKFWLFKLPFIFKSFERLKSGHRVLPLEIENEDKLILRWTGFTLKAEELTPMFDLFKVKDVAQMDMLLTAIDIPSWNFVFADTQGDIGYRMVGRTYRHTEKLPLGINTVTLKELKVEAFLGPEERPHILKPKRNYISSANNRHWPADAKYYGGRGYSYSFRGFRIDELLKDQQDVKSFQNIQCDSQVVDARFFLEKIQKHLKAPEFEGWTMEAVDSSRTLPLYRRLIDLLLEKWDINEYALYKMLDQLSFKQHAEMLEVFEHAKLDVAGRTWGQFHQVNFPHQSKNSSWVFSPGIAGVGDTHSVNPGTSIWNAERGLYEQNSGASMRMIIEMNETPRVWLALPGINRQYVQKPNKSPWEAWKNCEYTEVKF